MAKKDDVPDVSVVIPTAGEAHRWRSLEQAIASIQAGNDISVDILVVLNGSRYCRELRTTLEARDDIRVLYLPEGDLTKAIARGRQAVSGRYYCFLDDDDEYLPGSLTHRLAYLDNNPALDVLVSNGYRHNANTGEQNLMFDRLESNRDDPLMGLVRGNWLASCGGLFRTDTVESSYFLDIQKYFEWTWLAICLSLSRNIGFLDVPAFIVNDTPGSLSKSTAYLNREVDFLQRVLREVDIPASFRRHLHRKLAAKYIGFANNSLAEGHKREALSYYLSCLGSGRAGLAYCLWARKLFLR